jgi:hypothetical protein
LPIIAPVCSEGVTIVAELKVAIALLPHLGRLTLKIIIVLQPRRVEELKTALQNFPFLLSHGGYL